MTSGARPCRTANVVGHFGSFWHSGLLDLVSIANAGHGNYHLANTVDRHCGGFGSGHGGGTDRLFAKALAGGFSFRHRDADALPNKGFETGFRDEWRKEKFGNYMNSNDSSGSCKAVYLGFGSGGRFYCHQASSQ